MSSAPPPITSISVLTCVKGTSSKTGRPYTATKTWQDGKKIGFDAGWQFHTQLEPVANIHELAALLSKLEQKPRSFIIRALPAAGVDLAKRVRRKKLPDENGKIWFAEGGGQPWLMLDLDNVPVPLGIDPVLDPGAALQHIAEELLPPVLRNVGFIWQWSSSTGMGARGLLSAHCWFWLDRAMPEAELTAWANTVDADIDPTVFRAVQPHYTAAPIFKDQPDPLRQRLGVWKGERDFAVLPHVDANKVAPTHRRQGGSSGGGGDFTTLSDTQGFEGKLRLIGDGLANGGHKLQGFHRPLTAAVAAEVGRLGRSFDREATKTKLRAAVNAAPKKPGRNIGVYLSDDYLNQCISSAVEKYADDADDRRAQRASDDFARSRTLLPPYWAGAL